MQKCFWRGGGLVLLLASPLSALSSACLNRPLCVDCDPKTTSQFVLHVPTGAIDKVDLLFMIDNSSSMSDKQALLRRAVPSLVSRFVHPLCVDAEGKPNGHHLDAGKCAVGAAEFPAVQDIHIAIISSSLGAAGGVAQCNIAKDPTNDDRGWLLPKARPGLALQNWNGSGFLAWDPLGTKAEPPGTRDAATLVTDFQNMVSAVGETGCGYEASLESWYRFLIEPDPAASLSIEKNGTVAVGLDRELLAQRSAFLRPDSLVAIVMLTDENDCSLERSGAGFVASDYVSMPRATAACATNTEDPCCRSCYSPETEPPKGCPALADDVECKKGTFLPAAEDPPNLRCWDQKRRFGAELLEPTSKYISALTSPTVENRDGAPEPNPLFVAPAGRAPRDPHLIYLAGIVGVPWQDIASDDTLSGPGLRYLTAAELREKNRWDVILGDAKTRRAPSDPHMIESRSARSGNHPFLAQGSIAPADASVPPSADVISGHEQAAPDDLQYACIFELDNPTVCQAGQSCGDCGSSATNDKRPLCQAPSGGAFGTTQYYAKAYPSTRILEVLKGIGDQAIVASICPKRPHSADPESDVDFGYNPAIAALVDRLSVDLVNQCLSRAPEVDAQGHTSCVVVEADFSGQCGCKRDGRSEPPPEVLKSVRDDLRKDALCDVADRPPCSRVCACQLAEAAAGDPANACRSSAVDPSSQKPSYCYIDPDQGLGDPALVASCPATGRRLLRFVGPETPAAGSLVFMACIGSTITKGPSPERL